MIGSLFGAIGGLGLFLLGMSILTEGLKQLAGDTLRDALARFTTSATSGAVAGAIGTAILQSSSATTVMAVGFAGAGLLEFSQTLGIIFGANLGTTVTGWLVALLGFKLSLSTLVMPLVFVGAIMRLVGKRWIRVLGYTLAGFGLVFVGISVLQDAMQGLGERFTPDVFPPDTILGRFQLVLIGTLITLVTQSSSAGVAAAITAVHVGSITLPQAAAMVIGMDVGTTFTAALATVGGGVNARRTGFAHVVYNLITGVGAFMLLPVFISLWQSRAPSAVRHDPEIALVAFHTFFNGLGVVLALPLTRQFARLIETLVPAGHDDLVERLDRSLLTHASVAIDAVQVTLRDISKRLFALIGNALRSGPDASLAPETLDVLEHAISETRNYLSQISTSEEQEAVVCRQVACLHVVDHLSRMLRRAQTVDPNWPGNADPKLAKLASRIGTSLTEAADANVPIETFQPTLQHWWQRIDGDAETFRRHVIGQAAHRIAQSDQTLRKLDAIRWLRRVVYHAWRITYHLTAENQTASQLVVDEPLFLSDSDGEDQGGRENGLERDHRNV